MIFTNQNGQKKINKGEELMKILELDTNMKIKDLFGQNMNKQFDKLLD